MSLLLVGRGLSNFLSGSLKLCSVEIREDSWGFWVFFPRAKCFGFPIQKNSLYLHFLITSEHGAWLTQNKEIYEYIFNYEET